MENKNEKNKAVFQTVSIVIGVIIVLIILTGVIRALIPPMRFSGLFNEQLILSKILVSSASIALLVYLLNNYLTVYNKIKSEFSLGLIVTAVALLAYAISSNPVLHVFFGFRGSGLGPFTIIPDLFTLAAAIALLYLSRK